MLLLPHSLAELFELFARHPECRVMAGGTDLLPELRRVMGGGVIICLEKIPELSRIVELPDGSIAIGACATFTRIAAEPALRERYPLLTQAAATVGGPAIRNMATIGGNIATASPAGDSLPPLYILGALVELLSAEGKRSVPINQLISGSRSTLLQRGEIISRIILPQAGQWNIQHFEKAGPRKSLSIAVASLAAMIRLDGDCVAEARLAWGSVGPTVVRSPEAEAALIGYPLTEVSLKAAAALLREMLQPIDDIRATAGYRREVAGNLLFRLIN